MIKTSRVLAAVVAAATTAALMAPAAQAGPTSPTTAIVSLGDSSISGEAGRWQGNSNDPLASRDGTDRAWVPTWWGGYYDTGRVYLDGSAANGCHRSDVAEIRSAPIAVDEKRNLACSGAVTANVVRASSGGQGRNGEAPQADQLAALASERNVRLVVVAIGINDLGFVDIASACATAWATSPSWAPHYCRDEQQPLVNARMAAAIAGVSQVLDEVRAVMAGAGYRPGQYRLVLQGYPSTVPRGTENRYPESGWSRLNTGGCPFWNRDLDWMRDGLVGQIADRLRAVAASRGAQFLDLRDALQGREACARTTALATAGNPPSATTSEWARFLVSGITQGAQQESLHPNAYAQRALGRCVGLLWAQPAGDWACRNTPGQGISGMTLAPLTTAAALARAPRTRRAVAAPAQRPAWPSRRPAAARTRR